MAIEAHTYIVAQQPTGPSKWIISEEFGGGFPHSEVNGWDEGNNHDNKRKRSKSPPSRRIKSWGARKTEGDVPLWYTEYKSVSNSNP